jgi:hypothetical protein
VVVVFVAFSSLFFRFLGLSESHRFQNSRRQPQNGSLQGASVCSGLRRCGRCCGVKVSASWIGVDFLTFDKSQRHGCWHQAVWPSARRRHGHLRRVCRCETRVFGRAKTWPVGRRSSCNRLGRADGVATDSSSGRISKELVGPDFRGSRRR